MKDNYIQLLKWGRDKLTDGIEWGEIEKKLQELKLPTGGTNMSGTFSILTKNYFVLIDGKFYMTFEAFFQLDEHERLDEARKSSRNAMWIAISALIISIAVGLWQIMLMYYSSDAI